MLRVLWDMWVVVCCFWVPWGGLVGLAVSTLAQELPPLCLLLCVCSVSMSSEVQPRPDDSPNTSGGSSDAEQREAAPLEQPGPEQRDQNQPKKKEAKISSKTAAKLSTSAKR